MRLFQVRFAQHENRSDISRPDRRATSALVVLLVLTIPILILGGSVVILPASFNIKLGFLIAGASVFMLALMQPFSATAPISLLKRVLFLLTFSWAIWPVYLSFQGLPGPSLNPTRLIYWALFCLGVYWFIASRSFRQTIKIRARQSRPFLLLLVIYLGWALLSAIVSKEPLFSTYYFIKLMIGPTAIVIITLACIEEKSDVDRIFFWMVLAALVACILGVLEAVKKENIFYGLVPSLFPQGDDAADWAESLIRDKSRDGAYRIMSTFSHPLTFGEYLVLTFPLAAYLSKFGISRWHRFVSFVTLPLILFCVYLTHTRSNVVALGVVAVCLVCYFGIYFVKQGRSYSAAILGAFSLVALVIAIIAVVGLLAELMVGRTAAEAGSSMARLIMLQRGSSLVIDQPIFGYGPGRAAITIGFLPGITSLTIDSQYLSVALESGLVGLMLFSGLMVYPIYRAIRTSTNLVGRDQARVVAIACALMGFIVIKSVLSLTENIDKAFLLIALVYVLNNPERNIDK